MTTLIITTREGETSEMAANLNVSLMENIMASGVGDILALCGGCKACATCHVYVQDPSNAIDKASLDEKELLEFSASKNEQSRLACQVTIPSNIEQLHVTIAPEE